MHTMKFKYLYQGHLYIKGLILYFVVLCECKASEYHQWISTLFKQNYIRGIKLQ